METSVVLVRRAVAFVARTGKGNDVDAPGAVVAQNGGALVGRGAGCDHIVDEDGGAAVEVRPLVAERAGDIRAALAQVEANLRTRLARALEAALAARPAELVQKGFGLVEATQRSRDDCSVIPEETMSKSCPQ